jgi:hypothetical protein
MNCGRRSQAEIMAMHWAQHNTARDKQR